MAGRVASLKNDKKKEKFVPVSFDKPLIIKDVKGKLYAIEYSDEFIVNTNHPYMSAGRTIRLKEISIPDSFFKELFNLEDEETVLTNDILNARCIVINIMDDRGYVSVQSLINKIKNDKTLLKPLKTSIGTVITLGVYHMEMVKHTPLSKDSLESMTVINCLTKDDVRIARRHLNVARTTEPYIDIDYPISYGKFEYVYYQLNLLCCDTTFRYNYEYSDYSKLERLYSDLGTDFPSIDIVDCGNHTDTLTFIGCEFNVSFKHTLFDSVSGVFTTSLFISSTISYLKADVCYLTINDSKLYSDYQGALYVTRSPLGIAHDTSDIKEYFIVDNSNINIRYSLENVEDPDDADLSYYVPLVALGGNSYKIKNVPNLSFFTTDEYGSKDFTSKELDINGFNVDSALEIDMSGDSNGYKSITRDDIFPGKITLMFGTGQFYDLPLMNVRHYHTSIVTYQTELGIPLEKRIVKIPKTEEEKYNNNVIQSYINYINNID